MKPSLAKSEDPDRILQNGKSEDPDRILQNAIP